jgi:DNA polymerase I
MKREKIILIDGSGYFFRAFFAIQRLATSAGFPTNAIYGFVNMLMRVLEVEKPKRLAIMFDTSKPSFRKEKYKEYKSNRQKPPEDLVKQIPHILRSVDCFGIRRFELAGFEADDLIGTVAKRAERDGFDVEIITGDKDLMQLVGNHVTLYDTMKDKRVDANGVVERFGVRADQVVDFLALMGDASDNIPGVTGIGEKTAAELIRQFGSLDDLYANLDQIKQPKRREILSNEKQSAYLSRDLATIQCEMDLAFSWDEFNYVGPDLPKLQTFFEEFEFQNLLKRFDLKSEEKNYKKGEYEAVRTLPRLKEILETLSRAPYVAVDTETTSLQVHSAKLVGVSLSGAEGQGFYLPFGHHALGEPQTLLGDQLPEKQGRELLKGLLENPKVLKVGQHLKYDAQILRAWGIELKGLASDTLIASYLLDPDQPHNLDALAYRYLGHQNVTYEEVTGRGKLQISFAEVTIEKATNYSGEDADVTLRLHQKLTPDLEKHALAPLYRDVEVPLIEVLADMEYRGILIDQASLHRMAGELTTELDLVQEKTWALAGEKFNINSPKQLATILFEKLKLPSLRKTKTGFSTDESVLQALCSEHEVCQWIVKFRELSKLKSTYVEGLLSQVHSGTGRIHTSYNQTVAATGRLSSSNPNLQNIPAASDPKYDIRSVFIASEGSEFLASDYSQVELRLLADMSGDKELLRAFENNEDVHEVTAASIFGTGTVTPDQRKAAKTINFGVIYGQTAFGLSQQLGIAPRDAKQFIDRYFERYAGVRVFLEQLAENARQKGYATTLLGRRRYLPEIKSQNRMRREMAERAAINTPIQGTAADMIKLAMVSLYRKLAERGLRSRMLLQVHDELVLEVFESERTEVQALVKDSMENALQLKVPLRVSLGWGRNWRECT